MGRGGALSCAGAGVYGGHFRRRMCSPPVPADGARPLAADDLLAEIVLLAAVGFVPQSANTAANALVSFVCALQVQTFRKVRGHAYASTMCIGNMRSGTEALCAYFHDREPEALKKALTYFGVILLFAVGAGLGGVLIGLLAERAIWVSCALLAVSFTAMFIREEKQ